MNDKVFDDEIDVFAHQRSRLNQISDSSTSIGLELDELERKLYAYMEQRNLTQTIEKEAALAESTGSIDLWADVPEIPIQYEPYHFSDLVSKAHAAGFQNVNIYDVVTPEEVEEVHRRYGPIHWNMRDYIIVAISGLVAVILDFVIVKSPPIRTKFIDTATNKAAYSYSGGSPLTTWLNQQSDKIIKADGQNNVFQKLNKLVKRCEDYAKVPYDLSAMAHNDPKKVPGLRPKEHRLMSLGHDPLLGLLHGVLDLMNGRMTSIGRDSDVYHIQSADTLKYIEHNPLIAFIKVMAHYISDMFTVQGLPAPGFTILQAFNVTTPFSASPEKAPLKTADLARYMYSNGYDLRHFFTMGIVPGIIELIIQCYMLITNFDTLYHSADSLRIKYKRSTMLATAHTIAMSGNIVRMWLSKWNPMCFNYAEFFGFIGSIFRAIRAKAQVDKWVEEEIYNNWNTLSQSIAERGI